jgi:hypothetical protein
MPKARTTPYPPALIMRKAWALARHNSRRFGGSVRTHFPAALRQAWAEVRQLSLETAAMLDRVLAEVARIRAEARARADRPSRPGWLSGPARPRPGPGQDGRGWSKADYGRWGSSVMGAAEEDLAADTAAVLRLAKRLVAVWLPASAEREALIESLNQALADAHLLAAWIERERRRERMRQPELALAPPATSRPTTPGQARVGR